MSLSYQKLRAVEVRDPRTIISNEREYAVLRAGSQTTWKQFTTTSVSTSSIQFSCPPPSGGVIVDRKMYFTLPVRLTFSGNAGVGNVLLNPNKDAPRAYPISSSIDTFQATINNQSVSVNMADIVQALLHFNTDQKLKNLDYSMTPNCPDQSQQYSDLNGQIRNPLSSYGDSNDEDVMGRGGFPFTIVSNTQTSAVVDMVLTEPLFLSPFYWGHGNSSGFYNVTTMDFNITFLGNPGIRMWSHDALSAPAFSFTSVVAQFNNFSVPAFSYPSQAQPIMLFKYITPNETQVLSPFEPITYPYFDINRFPTDAGASIAAGDQTTLNSNNIQLNSIPRRMYVYVRQRNSDLYFSANNTDTFFSIENISIQFQNKNGLLASASKQQLYEMSVKNHCNMSWTQWSGGPVFPVGSFASDFGTIGSILCIEFASDIGLDSIEAPGKLGQYMLQVQVNATNINSVAINPTLYIVVVSEGTFTIEGLGKSSTNIGVITSQDILNAKASQFVNYLDVQDVNGGNFLSGLKDFGKKLLKGIEMYGPKVLKTLKQDIIPIVKDVAPLIQSMAAGEGEGYGTREGALRGWETRRGMGEGVMVGGVPVGGGRRLTRSELKRRLAQRM